MPLQTGTVVENNFTKGLITESTGLNFPENACTDTLNCIFEYDGSVARRQGFDYESGSLAKLINRTNCAINTYLWRNVAGDGNTSIAVVQVGPTIYFYKTNQPSFSQGAVAATATLTAVAGAPIPDTVEAQFSDGNGLLFVTHPYCEPFYVAYTIATDTVAQTNITVMIRDFEGATADPYAVDFRPAQTINTYTAISYGSANISHVYNLQNQGWTQLQLIDWNSTVAPVGSGMVAGAQTTLPSNVDVPWRFVTGATSAGVPPTFSPTTAIINTVFQGNAPAPNGHFILTLSNQDRNAALQAVTGVATSGLLTTTSGFQRPSTSAFFEGRLFYAGIAVSGFNSKVYFSRIVENVNQYGSCYQQNDPSAENLFDLLPDDGGVISIPEAGTIYKLIAVPGGLAVFGANGVWYITGSTGIGFTANDFSVQKIALIQSISATSFVTINGYPLWWNAEGIYQMGVQGSNSLPTISSLTWTTIYSFYKNIPLNSKKLARGFYNYIDGHVYWLYNSSGTMQITQAYQFDSVLNFNARTGAFYQWTVDTTNVSLNGLIIADSSTGATTVDNVVVPDRVPFNQLMSTPSYRSLVQVQTNVGVPTVDGTHSLKTQSVSSLLTVSAWRDLNYATELDTGVFDNVVDNASNQVITFAQGGVVRGLNPKFLVSSPTGGTYAFTWAEADNPAYVDWFQFDTIGTNFQSFFTAGYKLRGQAIRKFQTNWVRVFSKIETACAWYFSSRWNYAVIGDSGRWSTKQYVAFNDPNQQFSTVARRLKVRGHGVAVQFHVDSVDGQPFSIIGWGTFDSANAIP